MNGIKNYIRSVWEGWNSFWFTPTDPATLCVIRVLAGSMLLYTHIVWSFGLYDFFHPTEGWTGDLLPATHGGRFSDLTRYSFSYFDYITADWLRWGVHLLAIAVFACLMLGLFTRTAAVLAFIAAISYASRVSPGGFYGLDKVNCMLAAYLMLGPSGVRYSLDRLWKERRAKKQGGKVADPPPSISANVAVRLIQIHTCIIYLFGGLGKVQGTSWWDGTAVWWSIASYEYRSLDMTWLARVVDLGFIEIDLLYLVDFLTHATVALEVFYCCLVWNRWLRPWVVLAAIGMHLFIAVGMGMMTFGLVMIYANLAFVSPVFMRRLFDPLAARVRLMVAGKAS